jgi:CheY-like chemotaxis protein
MADILIIEDDPAVSMTMALLLESEGHIVRTAANGVEGIRQMKEKHPDLTLSDIEMPVLDGPSMALRLFVEDQGLERIPLVLLSGFPDIGLIAKQIGTPYYLPKPFAIDALSRVINRALAERIAPRPFQAGEKKRASP